MALLHANMSSCCFGRRDRIVGYGSILFVILTIWTLWYGMNSDKNDIPSVLTQVIPAGHCACRTSTVFECSSCLRAQDIAVDHKLPYSWEYQYGRDDKNQGLAEDQCVAAFPGLFEDVNRGLKYWSANGKITKDVLEDVRIVNGLTRAMIYNGNLYIIETKSQAEDHRRKTVATLSSIHRALVAYPNRNDLPNIEFVFSVEDKAEDVSGDGHPLWVLARTALEESLWLMPDFGYWAWDNIVYDKSNEISPYDEVVEKALQVEKELDFAGKESKLVWRGKLSFAPKLRRALLDQSRDQAWGDVKELNWKGRENYLALEDHCKYMFIAHAEGMLSRTFEMVQELIKFRPLVLSLPKVSPGLSIRHSHTQATVYPASSLPPRLQGSSAELCRGRTRLLRPTRQDGQSTG